MKILSIDAWGNKNDGFNWNNWFHVGDIDKEDFEKLDTAKKLLTWMMEQGYATTDDMRKAYVDDDQYNKVFCNKKTGQPIFAIEYGPEY